MQVILDLDQSHVKIVDSFKHNENKAVEK